MYGHWGPPLLGFPTSAGDEWELEGQGLIGSLAPLIDGGRVKFYSINSVNSAGFYNKGAHPYHRSYVEAQFDAYVREEVVPFIRDNCQSSDIAISTMGASFGAYHAANTLFKHPRHNAEMLCDFGRVRHRELHGRNVRRQHLLQRSGRLPLECGWKFSIGS